MSLKSKQESDHEEPTWFSTKFPFYPLSNEETQQDSEEKSDMIR